MRRLAATAAVIGTLAGTPAAAESACMTPGEARALIAGMMPDLLKATSDRCAATLPAEATLRGGLDPLLVRLRHEAAPSRLLAGVAATKMLGDTARDVSTGTKLAIIGEIFTKEITNTIKPQDCRTIDRAVALMAPLPLDNLAGLVVLMLQDQKPSAQFDICREARP